MRKSVFAVFLFVWCSCFASGENYELFRGTLSAQNENRQYGISEQLGEKDKEVLPLEARTQVEPQVMILAEKRRAMLLEAAASNANGNIQPILEEMDTVLADLGSTVPESDKWFSAAEQIIQQGKNSVSEKAVSYFSDLEATIERAKKAFAEESEVFQDSLESIFDQFSTVLEVKAQAASNEKSLLAETARLKAYIAENKANPLAAQLEEKIKVYESEAQFWADTVRQCDKREAELRKSLSAMQEDIKGAGRQIGLPDIVLDDQDRLKCQQNAEKVQAALYLTKVAESVQASCSDYSLQSELAQRNADAHLSSLFSEADNEAVNFVQKMNNSLLRDFSLAYYWRSQHNSDLKSIDVAIYSDQNFQKLKSYGYAFSHPEEYVNSQAESAYEAINADPEKKRLYDYFEKAVGSGTAQFDTSFIGKDISDIAHDYLWDVSVRKEKNYKKNHKILNFFTRKSSKMKNMRKAMADIDGSNERKEIMEIVENARSYLEAKEFYAEAVEMVWGDSVLYNFDTFILKCKEVTGISYGGNSILQDYFDSLGKEERIGFTAVLQNISNLIGSSFSLNNESSSYTLELLGNLDDYGSSANRLSIMNMTGTGLLDLYRHHYAEYLEKLCTDLSCDYAMFEGAMTNWDNALDTEVYRARKNWETALLEFEKTKSELELEQQNQAARNKNMFDTQEQRQSYQTALEMASEVDDFEGQVLSRIETANKKVNKQITDILEGKGYVRNGNLFKRKIMIDETLLGGIEFENQKIEGYRWFTAPVFDLGVDLSPNVIKGLDIEELEQRIEKAKSAVEQYSQVVFGNQDNSDTKGLFAMHIGYVPVMSTSNPEKVAKQGSGEYGRIFELFYKNEARLGRGLAAIDVPFYMQKLWDEDRNNDGKADTVLFSLPSIRQGGEIVCNIFSSINPALGMMVTAFDSTTFAGLDMVFAGKSFEDAAKDVNKRMALAASSWGTGSIAQAAQPAQNAATGTKLLQSAAVSVGKGYADQVASSAVDGNLDTAVKPDAKRTIGSLVRSWISSRLSGYLGDDRLAAEQVANFAGTLADAGYELATTGKAKFNVLNLSSFCNAHVGLLEMNIGGEGPIFEIGSGGYDISRNTVESAIDSAYIIKEENRIRHSSDFSKENKIAMRALFSEGKTQGQVGELYNLLLGDGASIEYGNLDDALAYTSEDKSGSRNIVLNLIPSGTLADQLKMAVILAHEAYRNGKDDGILQIFETADAVLGHAKMAYDILSSGFSYPDINLIKDEVRSLVGGNVKELIVNAICNYASGGDYWRIVGDGKAVWDGNLNLYKEKGDLLYNYQALKTALQSGVEAVDGVPEERLSDIVWKNTLLEMAGKKADGTYISKAAEALLSDGNMSYDEAINSLSSTAGRAFAVPDIFEHYSARVVANNTDMFKTYISSPDMLKMLTNRSQPVQYLDGVKATLLPDSKSVFHISPEDRATYKWVLDDGRELVIGERKDGTKYLQTDDHYQGTYNMANPDKPWEHALKDVFPYMLLGNTPDDSSIAKFLISM